MVERRKTNRIAPYRRIIDYLGDAPTHETLYQAYLNGAILGYQEQLGLVRVQVFNSLMGGDWLEKRPGENWRLVSERYGEHRE